LKITPNIRLLYNPVQPTVKQSAEHVTYQELLPDPRLQSYIYCYWQLRTSQPLNEPFYYRVVADGCMDIFFELNHPKENFVMGFCKKFTEFPLENEFNYVGIRFLPTMFPQIFKINASNLSDRFENLDAVIPKTANFIATHFDPGMDVPQIKNLLDKYLIDLLSKTEIKGDPRLYEAMSIILANHGTLNIETDLDTGLSSRQLRRLFQYCVGDSAKTFSKVVRFQRVLLENRCFMDGFYDQAHFIKEFTNFYGVTPGKALSR
jgi:AraC-like DNA-binding protein